MRITVNLDDAVVELLDASAEAHHESRAEFAGLLIETQLSSQDKIRDHYVQELTHREQVIKRQTDEIQGLRRLLDEARDEAKTKSVLVEGESGAILTQKNARIEELSAAVARLEGALGRAPAAGDVDRLQNDVGDLRARVQERERELLDLIYQEKGEKKALLERLPPAEVPKKGIWERLLGGGGGE